jgi:hypothetical protein
MEGVPGRVMSDHIVDEYKFKRVPRLRVNNPDHSQQPPIRRRPTSVMRRDLGRPARSNARSPLPVHAPR